VLHKRLGSWQIPGVRIYTRFLSPTPKNRGPWLYGALAVLLLGLTGWLWWHSHGKTTPPPKKEAVPAHPLLTQLPTNRSALPPTHRITPPPANPLTNVAIPVPSNPPQARLPMVTSTPPRLPATSAPVSQVATSAPLVLAGPVSNTLPPMTSPPPWQVSNPVPVRPVVETVRLAQDWLETQIVLARLGYSPGSIDGMAGFQTRAALRAFQAREKIPASGELDALTKTRLRLEWPVTTNYVVTADDLAELRPLSRTWLGKSQQDRLSYETILEMLAERARSHPRLLQNLNPAVAWTNVPAGTVVQLPLLPPLSAARPARLIRIQLAARVMEVFDAETNLIAHFPCSIAAKVDKRPVGELRVVVCVPNPNYTFNPEVFPESVEARALKRKLILPPGPNNPVGVAWIGLSRAGYGIHGTPRPEDVGRTESHGCFRLANWNAEYLFRLVKVGTRVRVDP